MFKDDIRLLYLKDGSFAVGFDTGEVSPGSKEHNHTILKKLNSPSDARTYAAGIIDGINLADYLYGKKDYEPIDPGEVKACQSFLDADKRDE